MVKDSYFRFDGDDKIKWIWYICIEFTDSLIPYSTQSNTNDKSIYYVAEYTALGDSNYVYKILMEFNSKNIVRRQWPFTVENPCMVLRLVHIATSLWRHNDSVVTTSTQHMSADMHVWEIMC